MGEVVQFPARFGPAGEPWEPTLTKRQVAAMLGRSTRWVELQVRDNDMPSEVGRDGRRYFRPSAVIQWRKARGDRRP